MAQGAGHRTQGTERKEFSAEVRLREGEREGMGDECSDRTWPVGGSVESKAQGTEHRAQGMSDGETERLRDGAPCHFD